MADDKTIVIPEWQWKEDFKGARDKNSLVDPSENEILSPIAGWDKTDLGIRVAPEHANKILYALNLYNALLETTNVVNSFALGEISSGEVREQAKKNLYLLSEANRVGTTAKNPNAFTPYPSWGWPGDFNGGG